MSRHQQLVTGNTHVIVLTEQEMPRAFEVRCTACHTPAAKHAGLPCSADCHRVTFTFWGEDHAREIGELHIFYMEHPTAPRIHHQAVAGGPKGSGGRVR